MSSMRLMLSGNRCRGVLHHSSSWFVQKQVFSSCQNSVISKKLHNLSHSNRLTSPKILNQTKITSSYQKQYTYDATCANPQNRAYVPEGKENDELVKCLMKCQSSLEVLDMITATNCQLDPEHLAIVMCSLKDICYEELAQESYIQRNHDIAFIQLNMNNELDERMSDIQTHPVFASLLEDTENCYLNMSDIHLSGTLHSLLYLGVDPTRSLITKLIVECRKRVQTMDLESLHTFSNLLKMLHRDFYTIRLIVPRCIEILDDPTIQWDASQALTLSKLLTSLYAFMSESATAKIVHKMNYFVTQPQFHESPEHDSAYIRLLSRIFTNISDNETRQLCRQCLHICSSRMCDMMQDAKPNHIAEICHSLKKARCMVPDHARVFEKRAYELLQETDKLSDVSNLCFALAKRSRPEIRRHFENKLFNLLQDYKGDVLIISNIADSITDSDCLNRELNYRLQELILEHSDNIFRYITRLYKVVKYLLVMRRRPGRLLEHNYEEEFREKLFTALNDHYSLRTSNISTVSLFLLPSTQKSIPDNFQHMLLTAIPKWKSPELYKLSMALNSMNRPTTFQLRKQLSELQNCLHSSISDKIEEVDSLDYLYQLTLGLVIHNRNKDPTLSTKIMQMYGKFTKTLTDVSVTKVAHTYMAIAFPSPEVYDDMINFVIENENNVSKEITSLVLSACALIGHQPTRNEEFTATARRLYNHYENAGRIRDQLRTMRDLCTLQIYFDKELSNIFQLDFLEEVDQYMEKKPSRRRQVEKMVLEINRNVVLECPQLDVPWFHEQQCKEVLNMTEESQVQSLALEFNNDIESALSEILGGANYMKRWVFTPYCHSLNFECVFDEKKRPVPQGALSSPMQQRWTRLAVLTLLENSFCYDSKQLIGDEQLKKRHLEIMGYKVVQIPHFEWYSMGMTDWQTKVDYLQTKVQEAF